MRPSNRSFTLRVIAVLLFSPFFWVSCDGDDTYRNYLRNERTSPGGEGTSATKGALRITLDKPCGGCLDYAELLLNGFGTRYLVNSGSSYLYGDLTPGNYLLTAYGHEYVTYSSNYYNDYGIGSGMTYGVTYSFGTTYNYTVAPYAYYSFYPTVSRAENVFSSSKQIKIQSDTTTSITFKF